MVSRIFVGDVQGCADELAELIERVRSSFGDDFELWSVGDLINRGPDNLGALRQMRELVEAGRARLVLGNHELNLMRVAAGHRALGAYDSIRDVLEAADLEDWIDWLRRQPLVLTGALGDRRFGMLHAAAHPEWSLDELERRAAEAASRLADPNPREAMHFLAGDPAADDHLDLVFRLTSCRSLSGSGAWSSRVPAEAGDGAVPWHQVWRQRDPAYGVIYGHWALQGLHVAPGLRGLDTGCVHHGRGHDGFLTAWVPDETAEDPFALPDVGFWQVPARAAYYAHKDAESQVAPG